MPRFCTRAKTIGWVLIQDRWKDILVLNLGFPCFWVYFPTQLKKVMFNVRRSNASLKQQPNLIACSITAKRYTSGERCRVIMKIVSLLGTIASRWVRTRRAFTRSTRRIARRSSLVSGKGACRLLAKFFAEICIWEFIQISCGAVRSAPTGLMRLTPWEAIIGSTIKYEITSATFAV